MKKILVILFLVALTFAFTRRVLSTANAAPERPPADLFLPQVEDDLPALPLEDFMIESPNCWPVQYNRCVITIQRDAFAMLKGIVSPIAYEGTTYRKISHHYYATHPEFEALIWAKGGEGLWVMTDDWRQGTIHYR